jgi:hypothetical protein
MNIGGLPKITEKKDVPMNGFSENDLFQEYKKESHSDLTHIKLLLIALILITLFKNNGTK